MIPVIIPTQGYELIRDRIAEILLNEFNNQVIQFYNTDCEGVKFYAERIVAIDKTETAFINISLFKGDYSNKDVDYVDGTYQFVIDIVTNSKTIGEMPGDTLAGYRLQRLIGMVRYILEHSIYTTLLFDRPFIGHTVLSKFQIYKPEDENDAKNTTIGQAIFMVRCGETTQPIEGPIVTAGLTQVKIGISDKGFVYEFGDGAPIPPVDTRYVYIRDVYGNVLYLLVGGEGFVIDPQRQVKSDWVEPYNYIGRAVALYGESMNVWQIDRIKINTDGTTEVKTSAANVKWTDRLTVIYT